MRNNLAVRLVLKSCVSYAVTIDINAKAFVCNCGNKTSACVEHRVSSIEVCLDNMPNYFWLIRHFFPLVVSSFVIFTFC